MMAEELVTLPDGREEWKRRGANHPFDTAVMCLAGAFRYRMYLEADSASPQKSTRLSDMQKGRR